MNKKIFLSLVLTFIISVSSGYHCLSKDNTDSFAIYQSKFNNSKLKLLNKESYSLFNKGITLNHKELQVNNFLNDSKIKLYEQFKKENIQPSAVKLYNSKALIESSTVFKIIKTMPKGGVLHIHSTATGNFNWLIDNATIRNDCYIYWQQDNDKYIKGQLGIFSNTKIPDGFIQVNELRKSIPDFDSELKKLLTLGIEDESSGETWQEFEKIFRRVENLLENKEIFTGYYKNAFEIMAQDNIQYVELRTGLGGIKDETGKTIYGKDLALLYNQIANEIKDKYQNFEFKIIYTSHRQAPNSNIFERINQAKELYKTTNKLVIGFDIIGEEDEGNSNYYYLSSLNNLGDLLLLIHSGESLLQNNTNVYDAYLLNAKRIGHGINLVYFDNLEKLYKKRNIAVELCPISNQYLDYTKDLRLHPGRIYLQKGIPAVLSSDDPAIFGNDGLSYDFWNAFISWDLDLKTLKKLSKNSIIYSGTTPSEKQKALSVWENKWQNFINQTVQEYNLK